MVTAGNPMENPGGGREAGAGCVPTVAEKIKQSAERSFEHPALFLLCFQRRKFQVFCGLVLASFYFISFGITVLTLHLQSSHPA